MEEKEKKEEEAPQEEIHDTEWYLDVLRATQELRMKRYRDIPASLENPQACVTKLVRTLKKVRMFQLRKQRRRLESLEKSESKDESEIESVKQLIQNLQSIDIFSVAKSLLPTLLMIPVPKKYQKPISPELQHAQDLVIASKDMQNFITSQHVIRSIPRYQVDKDNAEEVVKDAISSSRKEILRDNKKRPVRLEDMTRKQRRAAEYRIMREAENKTSKFITSLRDSKGMGVASIHSRQEAARKALMSMELPDKIREEVLNKEKDTEKDKEKNAEGSAKRGQGGKKQTSNKHGGDSKQWKKSKKAEEKSKKAEEKSKHTKQPIHPSWEAQKENREKQRLHIDLSAPKENKSIIFE